MAKTDTAERRLTAVPQASQLSEEELGAWLRTHGLHRAQLDEWRAAMLAGLAGRGASGVSTGGHGRRVKELERELRRKDRALAEAAALLMLKNRQCLGGRGRWHKRADRVVVVPAVNEAVAAGACLERSCAIANLSTRT